mgnify:CR=1 FL=1
MSAKNCCEDGFERNLTGTSCVHKCAKGVNRVKNNDRKQRGHCMAAPKGAKKTSTKGKKKTPKGKKTTPAKGKKKTTPATGKKAASTPAAKGSGIQKKLSVKSWSSLASRAVPGKM